MLRPRVAAVVAVGDDGVVGRDGDLPWHAPADLRRFRAVTEGGVVVAGARTQRSIVARLGRPLPRRRTVVVSARYTPRDPAAEVVAPTPDAALDTALALAAGDGVFVIGGRSVYLALLARTDVVHLTRVHGEHPGDVHLPGDWLDGFPRVAQEGHVPAADGAPACTFLRCERAA